MNLSPATSARLVVSVLHGRILGGPGSGNFGHAGRKGEVGGSASVGSGGWFDSLEKVSGAKGSNPGGVFTDDAGGKWYVKNYAKPEQAFNEHIANDVYKAVGVRAPVSVVSEDGKRYASKWIDDAEGTLGQLGLNQERADAVLDGFAADVLTRNWDAVGTGKDNVLFTKDGGVTRVDQGGALLFRAQGGAKPAGADRIDEWNSFVSQGQDYSQVFRAAHVQDGDALGGRAIKQIDRIVAARPRAGWSALVEKSAPSAPAHLKKSISEMLEARTTKLIAKRDSLALLKGLGGAGSGNFGHGGRPGKLGGSAKAKSGGLGSGGKYTIDQIAEAWSLKQQGKSAAEIHKLTSVHPSAQADHFAKIKKQKQAIKEAMSSSYAAPPDAPVSHVPAPAVTSAPAYTSYAPPPEAVAKSLPTDPFNAPVAGKTLTIGETAESYGYQWKEKTHGPNKGKYAFFKDGEQVSANYAQGGKDTAAVTMHYGAGPKAPAKAYVATPTPDGWPIDNHTVRTMGKNYPNELDKQGKEWAAKLTSGERDAIRNYTGSSYKGINDELRAGHETTTAVRIKNALAKSPAPPPPDLVWRGVSPSGGSDFEKLVKSLSAGDEVQLGGFQSTSIKPAFAKDWGSTVFEIKPKAGAYVDPISLHSKTEREYILPHNKKYKVRGITTVPLESGYSYGNKSPDMLKVIQLEML